MSAGTLTLTNKSAAVVGVGTAFTTELSAGDFVVVTVGGVPYTLPVKTVNSATSLTLVSNFTGPTQAGAAWSAVPRVAMNMVTAALVAQSAEALRGLNYDKQNWQQVFSGTGTITVKLPDGTSYSGPAWNSITTTLNDKAAKGNNSDITRLSGLTTALSVDQGGTGAKTAAEARTNLGLVDNTGTVPITLGGTGAKNVADANKNLGSFNTRLNITNAGIPGTPTGAFELNPEHTAGGNGHPFNGNYSCVLTLAEGGTNPTGNWFQIAVNRNVVSPPRYRYRTNAPAAISNWYSFRTEQNTTVDSNGFIKTASPIVKLFGSGKFETNEESEGVSVKKIGTGEYLLEGCKGLNADAAWGGIDGGFEVPADRNKQPLIWLDYEVNADGSVLVRTFHRTYPSAPLFARNEIKGLEDGQPADIPADQFVSIRVQMPNAAAGSDITLEEVFLS